MDSRHTILERIRKALIVKAPARHFTEIKANTSPSQKWFPPISESPADLIALFEKNCAELKTEVRHCADTADVAAKLSELAHENGWFSIGSHDFSLGRAAVAFLNLPVIWTDRPYDPRALERCDAGITGCVCLIAQTGGIMVTADSAGGRALSVLPPHHIVIATRSQLVSNLEDAFTFARKSCGTIPSFLSFITGPSRTGDIERILVLGAHGPKKLTILLINQ